MLGSALRWMSAGLLAAAAVPGESAAAPIACVRPQEATRTLAHPPLTGSIGRIGRVAVVLTRSGAMDRGAFDVRLRLPTGRCLILAGPEDPNELFLFDVTAVRFALEPARRGNALIILFNSSQIGPGRGTERDALAFRLVPSRTAGARATRYLFADVSGAADVLRRLRRAR